MPGIKYEAIQAQAQLKLITSSDNAIGTYESNPVLLAQRQQTVNYDGSGSFRDGDRVFFPSEADWNNAMIALKPKSTRAGRNPRIAIGVMVAVVSPGETTPRYLPFYLGTAKRRVALLKNPQDETSKEMFPFNDDLNCDWAGKGISNDADNLFKKICAVHTNDYDALHVAVGCVCSVKRREVETMVFPRNNQGGDRVRGRQPLLDFTVEEWPTSQETINPAEGSGAPEGEDTGA